MAAGGASPHAAESAVPAVQDYLRDRVEQYRGWYDLRARRCKAWYLRLRVAGLVTAAVVPLLVALPGAAADAGAMAAGLVAVLSIALDGMLRLREQWENYRYTEQYLDREKHLFLSGAGPYRVLSPATAFLVFVERVEWAIAAENSTTLATLALAPTIDAQGTGGLGTDVRA